MNQKHIKFVLFLWHCCNGSEGQVHDEQDFQSTRLAGQLLSHWLGQALSSRSETSTFQGYSLNMVASDESYCHASASHINVVKCCVPRGWHWAERESALTREMKTKQKQKLRNKMFVEFCALIYVLGL